MALAKISNRELSAFLETKADTQALSITDMELIVPTSKPAKKRSAVVFPKNRKVLEQLGDNINKVSIGHYVAVLGVLGLTVSDRRYRIFPTGKITGSGYKR